MRRTIPYSDRNSCFGYKELSATICMCQLGPLTSFVIFIFLQCYKMQLINQHVDKRNSAFYISGGNISSCNFSFLRAPVKMKRIMLHATVTFLPQHTPMNTPDTACRPCSLSFPFPRIGLILPVCFIEIRLSDYELPCPAICCLVKIPLY